MGENSNKRRRLQGPDIEASDTVEDTMVLPGPNSVVSLFVEMSDVMYNTARSCRNQRIERKRGYEQAGLDATPPA